MRVVSDVWNDKDEVRERTCAHIACELGERHNVCRLAGTVYDVAEVSKWIVVLDVWIRITPGISRGRNALLIGFPCLAGRDEIASEIVDANRA